MRRRNIREKFGRSAEVTSALRSHSALFQRRCRVVRSLRVSSVFEIHKEVLPNILVTRETVGFESNKS